MANRPVSFVQIHYHCRPGGVTRVMADCASAFTAVSNATPGRNLILCGGSTRLHAPTARVARVAGFDYRSFSDVREFTAARRTALRTLSSYLDAAPKPCCVVGHNLSLGKNCALSSAVAEYARQAYRQGAAIRFFSMLHDFAEEGRVALLQQVRLLESMGVDIWDDLYPETGNLEYVVVSRRAQQVLRGAGLPVQYLAPAVDPGRDRTFSQRSVRALLARLEEQAHADGTSFESGVPVVLSPSRTIMRKNVVEAIILSCILGRKNLLLGCAGSSAEDRHMLRLVKSACARYRLRVVFDAGRATQGPAMAGVDQASSFSELYEVAHGCVSTSVAEGFGFALYEPWLLGKPLVGRRPVAFVPACRLDLGSLYSRFLVPCEWVDMPALARLTSALSRSARPTGRPMSERAALHRLRRHHVRSGLVDFGVLNLDMQLTVLHGVLEGRFDIRAARIEYPDRKSLASTLRGCSLSTARRNRSCVKRQLSITSFRTRFRQCFLGAPVERRMRPVRSRILTGFAHPGQLRLLLASAQPVR